MIELQLSEFLIFPFFLPYRVLYRGKRKVVKAPGVSGRQDRT